METKSPKIRLFVEATLSPEAGISLGAPQSHYLFTVMRLGEGDSVALFNGRDGEWRAEVRRAHRKAGELNAREILRPQERPPPLVLAFAPIKKARTDFIVEKACELGCSAVQPVFTRFTNAERLRPERLRAHMIEAAEQCGGLHVPELRDAVKLDALLDAWPGGETLVFCDEARDAPPIRAALEGSDAATPVTVLIGPEGGFTPEEARRLRAMPQSRTVSLGPRILRADTAAVAALTLVQDALRREDG